ncbi:MAG: tRNA epoxyqueuosine(34) reductase QueG [Bryobacteraceae bacterium]
MQEQRIHQLGRDCGFDLVGIARAGAAGDFGLFRDWVKSGYAAGMGYLTDHRAGLRADPRLLLPSARSVICVGKLYNSPHPYSHQYFTTNSSSGWISRYAWGEDYHDVLRPALERLRDAIAVEAGPFESKVCVDTAPLLERSLAREAGLGWIGKNTCLIHEGRGSWFFLGELITSLDLTPNASPPPDRCGTCTRCIEACPTQALVPTADGRWTLDSNLCISNQTIEVRGAIASEARKNSGIHIFGCDVCQDVCPWNRRAPDDCDPVFLPGDGNVGPDLDLLATLTPEEFNLRFRNTPVSRARYRGFLRNVAIAMGNSGDARFRGALERLAAHRDPVIAEHARWALGLL